MSHVVAALNTTSTLKANLVHFWFVLHLFSFYYCWVSSKQVFTDKHEKLQPTAAIC